MSDFTSKRLQSAYENAKPVQPTSQPGSQDVATLMSTVAQKAGLQFENNGVNVKIQNPYLPGTAIQQMHALAEMAGIERIVDCGTSGDLAVQWQPAGRGRHGVGRYIFTANWSRRVSAVQLSRHRVSGACGTRASSSAPRSPSSPAFNRRADSG